MLDEPLAQDPRHFGCEAVVTGEGCLDAPSLEGTLPVVVARRAHALGLPVIAVGYPANCVGDLRRSNYPHRAINGAP
ncbi:MAG: glycerate kinase [Polyangia bacterium]